jgi:oligopeptide transport system ATP-binding protein
MSEPLLHVESLRVEFKTDDGLVQAVNDVSFDLYPGETLGIVGESGSGKSVTNLALMGLVPQPPGRVVSGKAIYQGQDLLNLKARELAALRGRKIAMIFQDPMTALNPFLTIAEQLTEVTQLHLGHTHKQAVRHAVEMLERVGIPSAAKRLWDYPHQFSGGMQQRVMIAMALACNPDILIADEPTTALDVTIQAQILELLRELQRDFQMAVILITHDLGVVAQVCHRVIVMYAGRIVEEASAKSLFADPRHPYTIGLLESVPRLDHDKRERLHAIVGQPPDMTNLSPGCAFAPRCPFAVEDSWHKQPPVTGRPGGGRLACFVDVTKARPHEAQAEA